MAARTRMRGGMLGPEATARRGQAVRVVCASRARPVWCARVVCALCARACHAGRGARGGRGVGWSGVGGWWRLTLLHGRALADTQKGRTLPLTLTLPLPLPLPLSRDAEGARGAAAAEQCVRPVAPAEEGAAAAAAAAPREEGHQARAKVQARARGDGRRRRRLGGRKVRRRPAYGEVGAVGLAVGGHAATTCSS
eukprot:scaffold41686_cov39-Phaeocystis_antarctica.AAC.2